jgi:hypothetical protein
VFPVAESATKQNRVKHQQTKKHSIFLHCLDLTHTLYQREKMIEENSYGRSVERSKLKVAVVVGVHE